MKNNLLPSELSGHQSRLDPDVLKWLQDEIPEIDRLVLSDFTEKLFELLEKHEVIDVELAYIACKGGVITGKLTKVVALGESKHPGILAYQCLAYLFMNNFILAEESLEKAKIEIKSINDIYIYAEVQGISIYLYNARYQFFQGVRTLQEMFEKLKPFKQEIKENPGFFQWIRISGAKSLLKLGYIKEAIYTNKRALSESGNDRFFKSFALLGLGHCFDILGKTKNPLHFYKRALKNAYEIKAFNLISIIFNRLGMTSAWRMDNMVDGESFFSEAIAHAEKGNGFWLKEGPQWNLIALYRVRKDYNKAISAIEDIIETSRQVGESRTELIAMLNLGELLEEKGDTIEASKVREAAQSLASIIGVELEDFYQSEDLEEEENSIDEEEFQDQDPLNNENFDINPLDTDFFHLVDRKQFDTDKLVEEEENFNDNFNIDDNVDEVDFSDDTDDIVRKFFRNKK